MKSPAQIPSLLLVGPLPTEGQYNGGIAMLLQRLIDQWSIPFKLVVYNLNTVPRDYGTVNRINLVNLRRFCQGASGLINASRSNRPELSYIHTSRHMALLKDMVLARLLRWSCGCKVIVHVHHATERTLFMSSSSFLRRMQLRFVLRSADSVVLLCESIRAELESMLPEPQRHAFHSKTRVLHNFTGLPPVQPRTSHQPLKLLFIGNVGPSKGVHELVAAIALLKSKGLNIVATLAGPFDSKAEGERLKDAARKGDVVQEIQFPGVVAGQEKERLFRSADIFVLPSHAEGVPVSMLEAMSYCLPVIATKVGGIPEIITEAGAGILICPGNVSQLAEGIHTLAASPELRQTLGEAGRRAIERRHTIEAFSSGLSSICTALTGTPALSEPAKPNRLMEARP